MDKRLEMQRKYFEERRGTLVNCLECIDKDIDKLSDYYRKLLKSTNTPSEKLAKVNEDLWKLRCKRIDLVDEINTVNYILDGAPEEKPKAKLGNIYTDGPELDFDDIIGIIVHGIKI